jgi:hypothetical protein
MKKPVILLALLGLLLATGLVHAASGDPYDLSWYSIDSGGVTFAIGGDYTLGGTAGQADADVLRGGRYILGGGFWMGGAASGGTYQVYLPIVVHND